jgi:polyhydroxyalkanoate synthesis regulator phasin
MTTIGDIREVMEAAIGKLSPAKAQQLAQSVMRGEGKEQVQKAAQDLLEWSQKNRQRITDLVRSEVRTQLAAMGVATKDDLDALKKRVRDLERGGAPKRSTAKKRTAARKPAAKKPAAEPPAEAPAEETPTPAPADETA